MSEQTYEAWDGKSYPWPPPSGWYLAQDQKWWPEGYGPKDDDAAEAPSVADKAAVAQAETAAVVEEATPEVEVPEVEVPEVEVPEVEVPEVEVPEVEVPQAEEVATSMAAAAPQMDAPSFDAPKVDDSRDRFERDLAGSSSGGGDMPVKWLAIGVGVLGLLVLGLLVSRLLGGGGSGTSIDDAWNLADGSATVQLNGETQWGVDVTGAARTITTEELGTIPAPPAGQVYVRTDVAVERVADSAGDLGSVAFDYEANGNEYSLSEACMAQAGSVTTAFAGSTGSGYLCWLVAEADAAAGTLAVSPAGSEEAVYFSVR